MFKFILIVFLATNLFSQYTKYKVKRGDSLSKISKMYKINLRLLIKINKTTKIYAGRYIKIPEIINYKVKKGDYLGRIAKRFNTSVEAIKTLNNTSDIIRAGENLKIPVNKKKIKSNYNNKQEITDSNIIKKFYNMKFIWPVTASIIKKFGKIKEFMNYGLLFSVNSKQKVMCSETGYVIFTGVLRGFGKTILIKHKSDFYTFYSGLSSIKVKEKQKINIREIIGKTGNQHFFFAMFKGGYPRNPLIFLIKK